MNIWSIRFDVDNYMWCIFKETEDMDFGDFLKLFWDEQSLPGSLPKDIVFKNKDEDDDVDYPPADMMRSTGTYCGIVNEKVKELLGSKYKDLFRFFPCTLEEVPEGKYYILDPTDFVYAEDVLDLENTEFKYLQSGGKDAIHGGERILMGVLRYTFTEKIKGHHFFRILFDNGKTDMPNWMYCDDEFKEFTENSNITGLKFTKIFEFED